MPDHFSEAISRSKIINLCVINRLTNSIFHKAVLALLWNSCNSNNIEQNLHHFYTYMISIMWSSPCKSWNDFRHILQCDNQLTQINLKEHPDLLKNLLWNKEQKWSILAKVLVKWFENGDGFMVIKCQLLRHFSTQMWKDEARLKTDEMLVLGGYFKWKDRFRGKQGMRIIICSWMQHSWEQFAYDIDQQISN